MSLKIPTRKRGVYLLEQVRMEMENVLCTVLCRMPSLVLSIGSTSMQFLNSGQTSLLPSTELSSLELPSLELPLELPSLELLLELPEDLPEDLFKYCGGTRSRTDGCKFLVFVNIPLLHKLCRTMGNSRCRNSSCCPFLDILLTTDSCGTKNWRIL